MNFDPVSVAVAAARLKAVCEEMNELLVRASFSPNIKERRDCSTGLFDARGEMVMQADAIPVHLGSMPEAVRAVARLEQTPGDIWILNDPFSGGTHLPDVTAVAPVHLGDNLIGYSAARAHHADVGGVVPGSMPAFSKTLEEEGVVFGPTLVVRGGGLRRDVLDELTIRMRAPSERRADLRAQFAACAHGAGRLTDLHISDGQFSRLVGAVLDHAELITRARIRAVPNGEFRWSDRLEYDRDGEEADLEINLVATVSADELTLDLRGSASQHEGNLNCPLAVTKSACFFAVRALFAPDVPACAGAYRPIQILTDPGGLLDAVAPAAVAAGNVETSSRVADVVLSAFGRAQGQGTMNNLTFGAPLGEWTYYETIGGGQGASSESDGASAVHVAMSNTLNTPVEALELELQVRVERYAVRRGSGGAGQHQGGDGVVRAITALEPMRFSIISERRRLEPSGAAGGMSGASGGNSIDGAEIPAKYEGELAAGQTLTVETPGGGGHGSPI